MSRAQENQEACSLIVTRSTPAVSIRHVAKFERALAVATLIALARFAVDTPSRHAHSLAERSLAAHDHFQNSEAVSQESCSDRLHLHDASVLRHDACLACLRASRRARPPGGPVVADTSPVPDPTGLELPEPGLTQESATGLPEGRAPPLT